MTGQISGHHEARINDALKQLGEEFRLGMVKAEEYRARRRALVESWGELEATTSPGSIRSRTTLPGAGSLRPAGVAPVSAPPAKKPGVMLFVAIGLAVAAAGAYFLLKPAPRAPANAAPAAAATPLSPDVVAVGRAADEFVAANQWDAAAIEAFLARWRALSAEDRARAADEPPMRTLRYKLDQNIQAESQLMTADSPPEARARLQVLEDFARALGGGS